MRNAVVCLLFAAVVSSPVHARRDAIKFEDVQERCVEVGKVKFGAKAKWQDCQITTGRWFATLDIMDQYQAQYCLGKGDGVCAQRAFTVFANRAYTPDAMMLVQRIDPGNAEYDDPLVRETKYGDILTLTARFPDGSASSSHYRWKNGRWLPMAGRGLEDLD